MSRDIDQIVLGPDPIRITLQLKITIEEIIYVYYDSSATDEPGQEIMIEM
jgi:hypothetical protein